MKFAHALALGIAAGVAFSGLGMATTASADPVTNGYALTGSDTLQDSLNALTNGTSVTGSFVRVVDANGVALGNFDAFGSAKIQTKPGGNQFTRPAGSGAGRDALRASIAGRGYPNAADPSIANQVDIARSSSGPSVNAAGKLAYVPYGRDAVSYAYNAADGAADAVLSSLTTAQLTQIYNASAPTTINGVTIKPRLPQKDSGTRSFFLTAIGVTTVGGAVPAADNTVSGPAENDATVLGANEIIPFSAASWIAQYNGAAPSSIGSTGVKLGKPGNVAPWLNDAAGKIKPNPAFYSAAPYGRDTYLIVERAKWDDGAKQDAVLVRVVSALTDSDTTLPSSVGSVKLKFGFLAPNDDAVKYAVPEL